MGTFGAPAARAILLNGVRQATPITITSLTPSSSCASYPTSDFRAASWCRSMDLTDSSPASRLRAANSTSAPKTKPAIHIITLYAFDQIRQLVAAKSEKYPPLTPREREVLAWSA